MSSGMEAGWLPAGPVGQTIERMWHEPYLETCCRSALHRLVLCGAIGRPTDQKDGLCLRRLADRGLAQQRGDRRYEITALGLARHAQEVLKVTPADEP